MGGSVRYGRQHIVLTALLFAAGCSGVERTVRTPQTLETQFSQIPNPGERGTITLPLALWPSVEAMMKALPGTLPPTSQRVQGRFEVTRSVRDPRFWMFSEADIGCVEIRLLDPPAEGTTGWLFSIGPLVMDVVPDPKLGAEDPPSSE